MRFLHALRQDLNKTLVNIGFLGAVAICAILCFTSTAYTDDSTSKTYSVFEAIFTLDRDLIESNYSFAWSSLMSGGLSGYASMFLPIIVAFPFMVSFCSERNSTLMRYTISRTGKLSYYMSKFTASLISGGLAAMLGVALYGLCCYIIFPDISSYDIDPELFDIIVVHSTTQIAIRTLVGVFLYGAFSTLPAFFISSFCTNPYLITCVPFLFVYIWNTAINKLVDSCWEREDYDTADILFDFSPDSVKSLANKTQWDISATRITCMFLGFLLVSAVGFSVIMNLRRDKGR